MSEVSIPAEPRTEFGKGAARRTRRAHKVPAVLYGHGEAPRHLSLPGHELLRALKTPNVLLALQFEDGQSQLALPRDIQRDPVRGLLEHLDLVAVRRGEAVVVDIPIEVVGELPGEGLLVVETQAVSVSAEATHLPSALQVEVSTLSVGDHVLAKDLALPDGVSLAGDPEVTIVHVAAPSVAEEAPVVAETDAAVADADADPTAEVSAG